MTNFGVTRRHRLLLMAASLPLLGLVAAPPAGAHAARVTIQSQLTRNFSVVVSAPLEDLIVVGTLHVVTHATTNGGRTTVDVHANLSNTSAVGVDTGSHFTVRGAQSWLDNDLSDDSIFSMFVEYQKITNQEAREDRKQGMELRLLLRFNGRAQIVGVDVSSSSNPSNDCDGDPSCQT